MSSRQLADAINATRQETGISLTTGPVSRAPLNTKRWANQRRITATALEA